MIAAIAFEIMGTSQTDSEIYFTLEIEEITSVRCLGGTPQAMGEEEN
jgi:hypothetical protein